VGVVDDDIQMTTTLICLYLKLVHHFIEGTGIDTTDINTATILVLLVRLIALETRLAAVLRPGSLVSCHSFLFLFLYFNSRSMPGISLCKSANVILLVDSLYAEAIEAVKSRAALSASG
jgi:hypothetical protein